MSNIEVITYHSSGNSFPIVITRDDDKFLVKLRAGLSGEYALLNEWFGNEIGRQLGLNTRQPHWILLPNSLRYDHIYIEIRDLISKSLGLNIGFTYIENVMAFDLNEIAKIEKEKQVDIFLLDLLMLNVDRTKKNHNILLADDQILITDYDSSLIFNELFNNIRLSTNPQILQCLKLNPFYQQIDENELKRFIDKIKRIDFEKILSDIPDELINAQNKSLICERIESKKTMGWNLKELLSDLDKTVLETTEERDLRTKKNRERLEKLNTKKTSR